MQKGAGAKRTDPFGTTVWNETQVTCTWVCMEG